MRHRRRSQSGPRNIRRRKLAARRIRGIVTQTGCAGHCKDEPTVEITLPGRRPVLYGHVTAERVAELVERQIVRGETAEGLIEA
jgi:NADP-reducing hydrogenase subunit HndB